MKKLLVIIGAVVLLGGIGACDIGRIEFAQAIHQSLIGLPLIVIGVV
jgi:hypothetical protein